MGTLNNFCRRCPRKLELPPTESCQLGLEFVTAQQESSRRRDVEERGCPWGIASAAHSNCFWRWVHSRSDEDGRMEPMSDQEICNLLGISSSALEKTMASALVKLRAAKDTESVQEFREAVLAAAAAAPIDNTTYMPDNFRMPLPTNEEPAEEEIPNDLLPKEKRRRNRSMPIHKDGKKTDIFGIYSRKTLERIRKK